jgi:hypothetical protein
MSFLPVAVERPVAVGKWKRGIIGPLVDLSIL